MQRRTALGFTLLVAVAAVGLPLWLAIRETQVQSYEAESARALAYARDVLHRSDATVDQALTATSALNHSGLPPCSPRSIAMMRQFDLGSSYIQAVGYVEGDTLRCSSVAGTDPLELGPVTFRTASGAIVRAALPPPLGQLGNLLVVENGHFAAIIHRDLPIDATTNEPGVTLAILQIDNPQPPVIARGYVDMHWLQRLGSRTSVTFTDARYLVALVRSTRYRTAAIAAVPVTYLDQRTLDIGQRLVPTGLLAGLALTAAIVLLARYQLSLPAALRAGLKRDEFFLQYQPVVDLRTGAWVGAEALLRWRRSTGELVSPDLFIPVAEQSGLITRITEKVLQLVATDTGAFLAAHPEFHVAVNLGADDLYSETLSGTLAAMLAAMRAQPSNLIVEVTERALLDMSRARPVVQALRASGIGVAIDDFGTGYSSLAYLESLHVDFLKIDRTFIEAIGTDAPTSQVVTHIIGMAQGLQLRMVAEGVETECQAAFLRDRGVQFAQGWLFGKPMAFADLRAALDRQTADACGHLRASAA